MHVEPFHPTLKYLYMKGKINRCVDKCAHLLMMNITKEKAFERLIKLEKGNTSYQISTINKLCTQHKAFNINCNRNSV